jgi:hypothetical protein
LQPAPEEPQAKIDTRPSDLFETVQELIQHMQVKARVIPLGRSRLRLEIQPLLVDLLGMIGSPHGRRARPWPRLQHISD